MSDAWIQTCSGGLFNLADPRPDDIHLTDIAIALSRCARFAGHTSEFYSVAEHSVHVSLIAPPGCACAGLMHDASEAYTGDIVKPLKRLLPEFATIEARIEQAIANRFGIDFHGNNGYVHARVKHADNEMLATERAALMPDVPMPWQDLPGPRQDVLIRAYEPEIACRMFLNRAAKLGLK